MKRIYRTPASTLFDNSLSPFPVTKPIQMHCLCDTGHHGTNYEYNKVGWADCGYNYKAETCPSCGNFYFFFVDKGGIAYNNKHNLRVV